MQNSGLAQSFLVGSIAALSFAACSANGSQLNPAAAPASATTVAHASRPATSSTCPPGQPGWALNGNIISDGDFAGTTQGNYTLNQFLTPTNWQVTIGDVDEEDSNEFTFGGPCSVDLDGHNPGAIAEVIPTLPNRQYKVKFYFSGNGDGPPNVKKLIVTADGGQAHFYHWNLNNQGKAQNGNYVIKHYHFTSGNGTTTTLQFASQDPYYSPFGPVVFQISARP